MADDPRKAKIFSTASNIFGFGISENSSKPSEAAVNKFLDNGQCLVLIAALRDKKGAVEFSNTLNSDQLGLQSLVFYKTQPVTINGDNFGDAVSVLSLAPPTLQSLYHAIHTVYSPAIIKGDSHGKPDPKIHSLVSQLEQGLGSVLQSRNATVAKSANMDEKSIGGILSPMEEFQLWANLAEKSSDSKLKERASCFYNNYMKQLEKEYSSMENMPFEDFQETLEISQDVLDDLWRQEEVDPPYPEMRMQHLLEVIGYTIAGFIQTKFENVDVWTMPYGEVKDMLKLGISLCDQWSKACTQLTNQLWKRDVNHPWKGQPVQLDFLNGFKKRLNEVMMLLTFREQLLHLLGESSNESLNKAFRLFDNESPINYNLYTQEKWNSKMRAFENMVEPLAQRILPQLRTRFAGTDLMATQRLRQFAAYKELIQIPIVKKELLSERESMLSSLIDHVKSSREDFNRRSSQGDIPRGTHMNDTVRSIVWARQQEAKAEEIMNIAEPLLGDLPQWETFKRSTLESIDEMQSYRREQFDGWSTDLVAAIEDPLNPVGLQTSGKLMELSHKKGTLRVNYSDRLVSLLREVRQLTGLGYPIPAKILRTANLAQKFYPQASILKQVAHFYNTIDKQMLPCQQAMMLDAALAFEKLVKEPKPGGPAIEATAFTVTWDDPKQLQGFIEKLQTAAEKLTRQNRRLRKYHDSISEKVCKLFNMDLLRHQQKWKEILNEIREIMKDLENQGFSVSNMKPWKAHWDRQLYKVLEYQYQKGLETLQETVPEMKVELIFRQQVLQFRPPIEEIRAKYFREMKKFLSIPNNFKGVHDAIPENSIFPIMIQRNSDKFNRLYEQAEELFSRLEEVQDQFKEWVTIGQIDIEQLIEETYKDVKDWEESFRMVKKKGREADRLPS